MTVKEFLDKTYAVHGDKYGIIPPPTEAQDGLNVLIKHFLGDDWYTVNPVCTRQANTEAIAQILMNTQKLNFFQKLKNLFQSI